MKNTADNIKIKIKNLVKAFGSNSVLDGVNLEIASGRSLVILGRSGSGKSVLIKTIIGLIKLDKGQIIVDHEDVTNLSSAKRFEFMAKCGFLFQGGALFDSLSVEDNITFYMQRQYNISAIQKKELAIQKLKAVNLPENILKLYPSELSGGMKKRVALARAICTNPKIIFFDEPTAGLDPITTNIINNLIIETRKALGATTIIITHDIASAYKVATDIAMLYKGKIIWCGKIEDIDKSNNEILNQFIHGNIEGPITDN